MVGEAIWLGKIALTIPDHNRNSKNHQQPKILCKILLNFGKVKLQLQKTFLNLSVMKLCQQNNYISKLPFFS